MRPSEVMLLKICICLQFSVPSMDWLFFSKLKSLEGEAVCSDVQVVTLFAVLQLHEGINSMHVLSRKALQSIRGFGPMNINDIHNSSPVFCSSEKNQMVLD